MPRINWTMIEREEREIEEAAARGEITTEEAGKQISRLHRDARDEYEELQREERDRDFGW